MTALEQTPTVIDRFLNLDTDTAAAARTQWPPHLPAPRDLTDLGDIYQAHQHLDRIEGVDHLPERTIEAWRQTVALMAKKAGVLDIIGTVLDHTLGPGHNADDLDADQLEAVWVTARDLDHGRLVVMFYDNGDPFIASALIARQIVNIRATAQHLKVGARIRLEAGPDGGTIEITPPDPDQEEK
jgi:hypothetical protein